MKVVEPNTPSLAHHLGDLIGNSSGSGWLKTLTLPVAQDSDHEIEVVQVGHSIPVNSENAEMAASRLANVIWPALQRHARDFQGKAATVVIGNDIGDQSLSTQSTLEQTLKINLSELETKVRSGMKELGINVERITVYTIQLNKSSYNIVTIHCDNALENWPKFRAWRAEMNDQFNVNFRLAATDSRTSRVELRAEQSLISPEYIAEQNAQYYQSRRTAPIPQHLKQAIVDWRDMKFFSIDAGITRRPEDLLNVRTLPDGNIALRVVIPMIGNISSYFSPFEDIYCVGVQVLVDKAGKPLSFNVQPVIAHNSLPLDFRSVNLLANPAAVSPESKDYRRLSFIRENGRLVGQLDSLFLLANRLITRQISSGSPVSIDLVNDSTKKIFSDRLILSEFAISTVQMFTQQLLATWVLKAGADRSIVVLRPQFRNSAVIEEMRTLVPDLEHYDLYQPDRRQELALRLKILGREDLVTHLAEATRISTKQRRLRAICHTNDLLPEDACRFKSLRSIVGNINGLQLLSVLLDSRPLPRSTLTRFAHIMNSNRGGAPLEIPPYLEKRVRKATLDAQRLLTR